jgi:hypothetical protein
MNLSRNVNIIQAGGYFAAGVTKRTSSILDMSGYEGVIFIVSLGTIINAGTLDAYAEEHSLNQTSGMARIPAASTVVTVNTTMAALTQSCIIVDYYQPVKRYVQFNITPASQNAVVLGITAIQYTGKVKPPTADASVLAVVFNQSPAEV